LRTAQTRKLFKKEFAEAIKESSAVLDEAAFPAYAHRNPLIDLLFWGRLAKVEAFLATKSLDMVLDFGAGSGVMSYILAGFAGRVISTDIEPEPFDRMRTALQFPRNIMFASASELASERYRQCFDVVVALDVLEHVTDLVGTLKFFAEVLKPGGVVVISGPTENKLYRIGRKLAGSRFTGEYHATDITRIEEACRRLGSVTMIATLYPVFPLFKLFSLRFP
jgi:2-polyprenyl-3-methyl-5-hydroxy-6-metoxy-1,4-benzoquinol methylase